MPDPHAFAVGGGFLVHNCIRYFTASRPPVAGVSEHVPGPNTFWANRRLLHKRDRKKRHIVFASE